MRFAIQYVGDRQYASIDILDKNDIYQGCWYLRGKL